MRDLVDLVRRHLVRDDAVTEVVAYTLMFALGTLALVFSMDMLVDAQEQGNEIASAKQINQVGRMATVLVHDAARAGRNAPNATFETTTALPTPIGPRNYSIHLEVPGEPDPSDSTWDDFWQPPDCPQNPEIRISTSDNQINATYRLSNVTTAKVTEDWCMVLDTTTAVHSSSPALTVRYSLDPGRPTVELRTTNR